MNWGAILNGIWWWDDRGGEGLQCGIAVAAGGDGVSDYQINLDPGGGLITLACQPQSVVDKFEIIHGLAGGTKVGTSAMTGAVTGPFDNVYGTEPTNIVPTAAQAGAVDQFIGNNSGNVPTRQADFTAATGYSVPNMTMTDLNGLTIAYQQLVWWQYSASDYQTNSIATVRVTGINNTQWNMLRICCPDGFCS
jgi:hypothetical protein